MNLSTEKISAIAISVLVVGVLAYKAVVEGDAQSTTALIALASPAAAVAIIRRQESVDVPPTPALTLPQPETVATVAPQPAAPAA